jgi:rhomboid protease GluP
LNFIERTGQIDRLRRSAGIVTAGTSAMFGSLLSGSWWTIMAGTAAGVAALLYDARAIRCPRCGYNLSWHAFTTVSVGRGDGWVTTATACPRCHLGDEAGAHSSQTAPFAAAPTATPAEAAAEGAPANAADAGVLVPPDAFGEPPPHAPWRVPLPVLEDLDHGYGYMVGGTMHACTRDDLFRLCDGGMAPPVVWTPETPRPTWFHDVPELMRRYRTARVEDRRRGWWGPAAFFVAVLVGMLTSDEPLTLGIGPPFWLAASGLLLGIRLHARHAARRLDAAAAHSEMDDAWHDDWLRSQPGRLTQVLMASLCVAGVAQVFSPGDSAQVAGMLPAAVVQKGEWWRLLSHGVMHGNVVHIAMNLLALASLGKLMEVHANRALLSPVLLAGIVGGGVAGLVVGPDLPMVGVSGGLLGLIGFLTVVGFRRRERVPRGFTISMLKDVAFVAAVGLVGFRFIANAAHLGGLLAGLALGVALVPRAIDEPRVGWAVRTATAAFGWACSAVLVATCAATALYLFGAPK